MNMKNMLCCWRVSDHKEEQGINLLSIEDDIKYLNDAIERNELLEVTRALSKLSDCRNDEYKMKKYAEAGCLETIIKAMKSFKDNGKVQSYADILLTMLATNNEIREKLKRTRGAYEAIHSAYNNHSVCEKLMVIIWNHNPCSIKIRYLRSKVENEDIVSSGMGWVLDKAKDDDDLRTLFRENLFDYCKTSLEMHPKNSLIVERGCYILCKLIMQDATQDADKISFTVACDLLISKVGQIKNVQVQHECWMCLSHLLNMEECLEMVKQNQLLMDKLRVVLVDDPFYEKVLELLGEHPFLAKLKILKELSGITQQEEDIIRSTLRWLIDAVKTRQEFRIFLKKPDKFDIILDTMFKIKENKEIQELGCELISTSIHYSDSEEISMLSGARCVMIILEAMKQNESAYNIQKYGCHSLSYLVKYIPFCGSLRNMQNVKETVQKAFLIHGEGEDILDLFQIDVLELNIKMIKDELGNDHKVKMFMNWLNNKIEKKPECKTFLVKYNISQVFVSILRAYDGDVELLGQASSMLFELAKIEQNVKYLAATPSIEDTIEETMLRYKKDRVADTTAYDIGGNGKFILEEIRKCKAQNKDLLRMIAKEQLETLEEDGSKKVNSKNYTKSHKVDSASTTDDESVDTPDKHIASFFFDLMDLNETCIDLIGNLSQIEKANKQLFAIKANNLEPLINMKMEHDLKQSEEKFRELEALDNEIISNKFSNEEKKLKGRERDALRRQCNNLFNAMSKKVNEICSKQKKIINSKAWKVIETFEEVKNKYLISFEKFKANPHYLTYTRLFDADSASSSSSSDNSSLNWIEFLCNSKHNNMEQRYFMRRIFYSIFISLSKMYDSLQTNMQKIMSDFILLKNGKEEIAESLQLCSSLMESNQAFYNKNYERQLKREKIKELKTELEVRDAHILDLRKRQLNFESEMMNENGVEKANLQKQLDDVNEKLTDAQSRKLDIIEELNETCHDGNSMCLFPDLVENATAPSHVSQSSSSTDSNKVSISESTHRAIRIPLALKLRPHRCELLGCIGQGGFSSVFKMRIKSTKEADHGTLYAFKKYNIYANLIDSADFEVIEKEIEMLSYIKHDNIVKVIGAIGDSNVKDAKGDRLGIGIAMEFCDNLSIKSFMIKNAKKLFNVDLIVFILHGAAQGLDYLHDHEPHAIIHGDIKSDNILVDKEYNAKICDFGISKLAQTTKTSNTSIYGNVGGTLAYKAPETFKGRLEPKSDVYSFGCVILEMLTGERPWQGCNEGEITTKVTIEGTPHDLTNLRKDAPKQLVNLMKRCLEYEKERRPTMKDVVQELKEINKLTVLINLDTDSEEYKMVEQMFFPGGDHEGSLNRKNYKIVTVEKTINMDARRSYLAELERIKNVLSKPMEEESAAASSTSASASAPSSLIAEKEDHDVHERYLFHGTSETDPKRILDHPDALMVDYSQGGYYGKGLYFAELARYPNGTWKDGEEERSYRYNIPNTTKYQILVCSVICGRSFEFGTEVGESSRMISQQTLEGKYHSIHAGPHQPSEAGPGENDSCMYVIYKDAQILPKYLITYEEL